jgi:hypothetical protein
MFRLVIYTRKLHVKLSRCNFCDQMFASARRNSISQQHLPERLKLAIAKADDAVATAQAKLASSSEVTLPAPTVAAPMSPGKSASQSSEHAVSARSDASKQQSSPDKSRSSPVKRERRKSSRRGASRAADADSATTSTTATDPADSSSTGTTSADDMTLFLASADLTQYEPALTRAGFGSLQALRALDTDNADDLNRLPGERGGTCCCGDEVCSDSMSFVHKKKMLARLSAMSATDTNADTSAGEATGVLPRGGGG